MPSAVEAVAQNRKGRVFGLTDSAQLPRLRLILIDVRVPVTFPSGPNIQIMLEAGYIRIL